MTTAIKDGKPVTLYVTTTETGIASDLAAGALGSLILDVRNQHWHTGKSPDTDHFDLAVGAFSYHIAHQSMVQSDKGIHSVDKIPAGIPAFDFGGNPPFAIRLYEQTEA